MNDNTAAQLLDSDPGVKDVALVPAGQEASGLTAVIQQLAANPNVDVDKLERIIHLQKDIMRINAKSAFDAAFAQMQAELPEVVERGAIKDKTGGARSTYAKLEDIHVTVKPVLTRHRFAVRHRTEWPEGRFAADGKTPVIRIVGILSHAEGHSEESCFEAPMDRSDFRTDIQSQGSTISYGRRYTTLDLLNIATRNADDDGQTAGRPQAPAGYEAAFEMLKSVADGGTKALEDAWSAFKPDFKTYTVNHNKDEYKALRERAAHAAKGRRG